MKTAVEEDLDALFVSSSNGHAAHFCRGLREALTQAGAGDCLLYVGGNLAVSAAQEWAETERQFLDMGFNRVYPPGVKPAVPIADLAADIEGRRRRQ